MKYSSILLAAVLTAVTASTTFGQLSDANAHPDGFLRKPTPTPEPNGATAAPASGKPLEANLSTTEKGKTAVTEFPASTKTIYAVWADGSATKGEKIRASWVAVDTGGALTKNKKLVETTKILPGPLNGSFILDAPKGGFPPGKYRADLYEGSKLAKTLPFSITK